MVLWVALFCRKWALGCKQTDPGPPISAREEACFLDSWSVWSAYRQMDLFCLAVFWVLGQRSRPI